MTQPPEHRLEESRLHQVLVLTNQLQELPAALVAFSFAIASALAGIVWLRRDGTDSALLIAIGVLAACIINWVLLRRLPDTGRSFGPDQPTALVLGATQALIAVVVGLVGAPAAAALILIALVSAVAYYATWVEPFYVTLTRQAFRARAWSADSSRRGADCLRLIHVSDLHVERTSARERRLNAMIAALQPDLIVFSGDFVNLSYTDDPRAKADIRAILSTWKAPLGVYCVPGTPVVEPLPRVVEFVAGLDNITLLTNTWHTVETSCGALQILGMITTHDLAIDRAALATMMESAPEGGVKLLLTHSPDIAPEAAAAGFDLYLCGHTHGGQIRLPLIGALLSSSQLGKRFVMGRYQVDQMTLYTSRGLGMEGYGAPRARLLCTPEVILWEFNVST